MTKQANRFEFAARAEKVGRILDVAPLGADDAETQAIAAVFERDDHVWSLLLRAAQVERASAETRRQVVACVRARRSAAFVLGMVS